MDIIKLVPSPTFLSVLDELHVCPGAPKSVKNYFLHKQKLANIATTKSSKKMSNIGRKDVSKIEETTGTPHEETPEEVSSELLLLPGDVKWCHQRMRERGMKHRIHELLNESTVLLPAYKPRTRNPELEQRLVRLRNEQENREYQKMTQNISRAHTDRNSVTGIGQEMRAMHKELNRQIVAGIQYIISIVGTFFGLFVGLSYGLPELAPRLLIAVIGALVVALAEIYFIIREDLREEFAKTKKVK